MLSSFTPHPDEGARVCVFVLDIVALGGTVLQAVGIPIFSFLYHARRADSPRTGFGDAAAAP